MAKLENISANIGRYEGKIEESNIELNKYEALYETLLQFKAEVVESQSNFNACNSGKNSVLDAVKVVSKNSKIAKIYYTKMKKEVSGLGGKITKIVYGILLNKITRELKEYLKKISDCEEDIARYQSKLNDEQDKYDAERERLLEEARA